jgi:hypothetical protein
MSLCRKTLTDCEVENCPICNPDFNTDYDLPDDTISQEQEDREAHIR